MDERSLSGYRHEAFMYAAHDEFIEGVGAFTRAALDAEEPILVIVSAEKIRELAGELGTDAPRVEFADITDVGANPARIIPAWRDFVAAHPGRPVRGVGEPIWAERRPAELVECERHEALLNGAFGNPDFWLLCPYDTRSLDDSTIATARRNHPHVLEDGRPTRSDFPGTATLTAPFTAPLPEPPTSTSAIPFGPEDLASLRHIVAHHARQEGLSPVLADDLMLAAHEVAANSVRHGGGHGTLRVWREHDVVLCEVRDSGAPGDPFADRSLPPVDAEDGRGLWLANQLCNLVQIRSLDGTHTVRLHMYAL